MPENLEGTVTKKQKKIYSFQFNFYSMSKSLLLKNEMNNIYIWFEKADINKIYSSKCIPQKILEYKRELEKLW